MHVSETMLRAKLDGELPADRSAAVESHLKECAACRTRAGEIEARAKHADALLSNLPSAPDPDLGVAWSRVQARAQDAPRRRAWLPGRFVPAWGGALAAILLVGGLLISGSARAVAQKLLAIFRVQSVVVVPMERGIIGEGKGKLIGDFVSNQVNVTKNEKSQPAATREEASDLAGFAVRLPAILTETPRFTVRGAHAFEAIVDAKRIETLISMLDRPDLKAPAGIDGVKIAADIPRGVAAAYGDCRAGDCYVVEQAPSPTVVTVPEINVAELAELALQFTGMSAEDARRFSRTVDWTSTLAIPMPVDTARYENVSVDGVTGVLIQMQPRGPRPAGFGLIWVKHGIIYGVHGRGNPTMALAVAQSLQ